MDWIDLAQDMDQWTAQFLSSYTTSGLSRRVHLHGVSYKASYYNSSCLTAQAYTSYIDMSRSLKLAACSTSQDHLPWDHAPNAEVYSGRYGL
jgi:hypothetical protein